MNNRWTRTIGVSTLIAYIIYDSYLITNVNTSALVLSILYLGYNLFAFVMFFLFIVNSWTSKIPRPRLLKRPDKKIAVIIPTWMEPVDIVETTVISVLTQNYPTENIYLIVSDDARNPKIEEMTRRVSANFDAKVLYHVPPSKESKSRKGEAKSGNLNSALTLVQSFPEVEFVETRDADDVVGHPDFLLHTLGQLEHDKSLAYVQTTKEAFVDRKDRFNNREQFFYRTILLYKNGANAIFPCGSGLVWRKSALNDIEGFPDWNLVEDFQSGAEALSKGWNSIYLPIVGAIAQVPPEDIPNVYKQRGTWALDSLRFLFWGAKKGLNLRQFLHFIESGIMYLFSGITYLFSFIIALLLFQGIGPIASSSIEITVYHFTWLLGFFLYIRALTLTGNLKLSEALDSIRGVFSLGPIHLKALLVAILYGPNRKPKYIVTRKNIQTGFYLVQIFPQLLVIIILSTSVGSHIVRWFNNGSSLDIGNAFWAIFLIYIYSKPIINMFAGLKWDFAIRVKGKKNNNPSRVAIH